MEWKLGWLGRGRRLLGPESQRRHGQIMMDCGSDGSELMFCNDGAMTQLPLTC
jgi:hypothetical protein